MAAVESETAGLTGDGEEGLECLAVQVSTGHFSAVVGHEVDHEVVRSGRDESREGSRKVVGVVEDGPPGVVVGVSGSFGEPIGLSQVVELLEPASLEDTHSSAVEVSVALDISSATVCHRLIGQRDQRLTRPNDASPSYLLWVETRPPAEVSGRVGVNPEPIDQVPVTGSPESPTETTARNKERSGAML
jgi:hypothetical protein